MMKSFFRLTFMTAIIEAFVSEMMSAVEEGVTWGTAVLISVTALLMAVTVIGFVINYAKTR